jgi:hypothetical protein
MEYETKMEEIRKVNDTKMEQMNEREQKRQEGLRIKRKEVIIILVIFKEF